MAVASLLLAEVCVCTPVVTVEEVYEILSRNIVWIEIVVIPCESEEYGAQSRTVGSGSEAQFEDDFI